MSYMMATRSSHNTDALNQEGKPAKLPKTMVMVPVKTEPKQKPEEERVPMGDGSLRLIKTELVPIDDTKSVDVVTEVVTEEEWDRAASAMFDSTEDCVCL